MSPAEAAEAIERARLELLRQGTWDGLRESERTTRIEVALEALERSGVAEELASLAERAAAGEAAASRAITRAERAEARIEGAEARAAEAEARVADAEARARVAERRAAEAEARAEAQAAEAEAALAALATERHASGERPATVGSEVDQHPARRRRTPWGARPTVHGVAAG
jgi:colicin import membrane protein